MNETGKISVQTENIFPIIKKWLYSERDIFLRELVSNAVDAINKLKKIALTEEFEGGSDYRVDIYYDQEARTLTVEDNGIGMTAEEVKKYINQIAFSSAQDFAQKYKMSEGEVGIIGHFGLGFYSSFMVSKKVIIETKSYIKDSQAICWESESGIDFKISPIDKTSRGTKIILHMDSESGEYLDKWKLKELVKKYCDFLPVPIYVSGELANKQKPLWVENPSNVKAEDYKEFYNYLFPFSGEAHFHIHLNVDYPFRVQGILYFPKLTHELDASKSSIKLYCNHVFVSDGANELVPEFLTVLRGAVDIPDLPLNVSRSYLQTDPLVKKISAHIVKKIADRLSEEYKKDSVAFQKIWEEISIFVKFGMMQDEKFYEGTKDVLLFKSSNGGYVTLEDYWTRNKEKNSNRVFYAPESEANSGILDLFRSQGLEAIFTDSRIDTHFLQFLEGKNSEMHFQRVDSDVIDQVIDKEGKSNLVDSENKTEADKIKELFENVLKRDGLEIKVEALKSADVPAMIILPEYMRRISEMNLGVTQDKTKLFRNHTLLVNSNSRIVKSALNIYQGVNIDKAKLIVQHIYDLAQLSAKIMSDQELGNFLKRANSVLESLI